MTEFRCSSGVDCKLLDLSLHTDKVGYFLSAKYRIENATSIREIDVPKIRLRVNPCHTSIYTSNTMIPKAEIDLGFGYLPLEYDDNHVYFTERIIEEKTHEMTLDEIEKKLGYKVKIVNK